MARNSRHFWKAGLFAVAAVTVALPPALASMTRADRIRDTQLSNSVLGQFTPASGDPRLIARYIKISEEARRGFSFTPALPDDGHKNRAITVVILIQTIFLLGVYAEILVTTNGGPGYASTNLPFLIYRTALLGYDVGGASAGGIIAVILANIVAFFLMRAVGKNLDK